MGRISRGGTAACDCDGTLVEDGVDGGGGATVGGDGLLTGGAGLGTEGLGLAATDTMGPLGGGRGPIAGGVGVLRPDDEPLSPVDNGSLRETFVGPSGGGRP